MRFLALFSTLSLLALSSFGCKEAVTPCESDLDCDEGYSCDDRSCVAIDLGPRCQSDSDCDEGYFCGDDYCVARGVGSACGDNDLCAGNLFCADNLPGGYCTKNCEIAEDCPTGSSCFVQGGEGFCLLDCTQGSECREGYVCSVGVCFIPCTEDAECPGGFVCLDGICEGVGVGLPCHNDEHCNEGLVCAYEEIGGYCTQECGEEDSCPLGAECGSLFGEERCLASCRADEDCRRGSICYQGACTPKCEDDDCVDGFYCGEAKVCVEEITDGLETIEFGEVSPGALLDFHVPEGTHSITLMIHGFANNSFQINKIVDPEGTERVTGHVNMGFGDDSLTSPHRSMRGQEIAITQIPNSDFPGMELIPGDWNFSFSGEDVAYPSVILKRGGLDGGIVSLNIFVAPNSFPGSFDASNLSESDHFQAAMDVWDSFYSDQANIELGDIQFFDLPPEYTDLELDFFGGQVEHEEMFRRFSKDGALNIFFVRSLGSGFMGGVAGVSGGIPGPPGLAGTLKSGVVISVQDEPRYTGLTLTHEAGHYFGLFHVSENNMFGGPQVHDMISDTPECRPGTDPCTESQRHIMFPSLSPSMEILSPASADVVRANASIQ